MSKFLTGKDLEDAVYNIIWDAKQILLIVSPYIKLDKYFKDLFDKHENDPNLNILLVFGKNESSVKKSMSKEDFDYFKKFSNISIIHAPNLHAKYYGNEKGGVITSINLYDYSFKNNIEFGVHSTQNVLSSFKASADNDAWDECINIAETNQVVFIKRPVIKNKKLIINIGKEYIKSEILLDATDHFYGAKKNYTPTNKKLFDFPDEIDFDTIYGKRPEREDIELTNDIQKYGYCIRTGTKIKYNPKQPMSIESWKVWSKYSNENFPEKFCHKTGQPSNGKTSVNSKFTFINFSQ